MKYLLIKLTDPDIQTKKLRYSDPDSALTDPTFYYPDPDSVPPNIRISGFSDRIRIESGSRIKTSSQRQHNFKSNISDVLYFHDGVLIKVISVSI